MKNGGAMQCKNTPWIWLVVIFLPLSLPTTARGAPKVTIKPKLSTSWRVDDNYFRAERNKREVYTYLVQPGIELGIETPKSSLTLDYTLDAYWFDERDTVPPGEESAEDDDFIGHSASLSARHRPTTRLLVGLNESFFLSREPGRSDPFSISEDRSKFFINQTTPLIFYDFAPKFTAGLQYTYTEINFSSNDPDKEDSSGHRVGLDLIYKLSRTTAFDLGYQHWTRDYDGDTSSFTSDQGRLTLTKKFRLFTFNAGAGYHSRNFDDETLDDISVFVYNLGFQGEGAFIRPNRRTYVSFDVSQNFNDYGPNDEYFRATRFTLAAGHEFTRRLSGDLSAYYQISHFERTTGQTSSGVIRKREDDNYGLSGTLSYIFARWLTLYTTGGYEQRDSNIAGEDYENRFFLLGVRFAYTVGGRK